MKNKNKPAVIIIHEDEWWSQYNPIKNHFTTRNGSWDDCCFETFGDELAYIEKQVKEKPLHVWTLLDGGVIICGFHIVNRLGYFVTENPYPPKDIIEVNSEESDEMEDEEDDKKTKKKKWKMPKWMEWYRPYIQNTGGNTIEDLYNDDGTNSNVFNNAPRALLCVAVKSQVDLLTKLHELGHLDMEK